MPDQHPLAQLYSALSTLWQGAQPPSTLTPEEEAAARLRQGTIREASIGAAPPERHPWTRAVELAQGFPQMLGDAAMNLGADLTNNPYLVARRTMQQIDQANAFATSVDRGGLTNAVVGDLAGQFGVSLPAIQQAWQQAKSGDARGVWNMAGEVAAPIAAGALVRRTGTALDRAATTLDTAAHGAPRIGVWESPTGEPLRAAYGRSSVAAEPSVQSGPGVAMEPAEAPTPTPVVNRGAGAMTGIPFTMRQLSGESVFPVVTEPSVAAMARSEQGGVKRDLNKEQMLKLIPQTYSGDKMPVIARELVQNAVDAVEGLPLEQRRVRIHLEPATKLEPGQEATDPGALVVEDNGPGMTREHIETQLTDLGGTGKTGQALTRGGFGIGADTFLEGAARTEIVTTHRAADGTVTRIEMDSTPEKLETHVPLQEYTMPPGTPTGTRIRVTFHAPTLDADPFDRSMHHHRVSSLSDYLDDLTQASDNSSIFRLKTLPWDTYERTPRSLYGDPVYDAHEFDIPGAKVRAVVRPGSTNPYLPENRRAVTAHITNQGMFTGTMTLGDGTEFTGGPASVQVNVHPTVEKTHPDYPFPLDRKGLKDAAATKANERLTELLLRPMQLARSAAITKQFTPSLTIPGTSVPVIDPHNVLGDPEVNELVQLPAVQTFLQTLATLTRELADHIYPNRPDLSQHIGLIFAKKVHGVNVKGPNVPAGIYMHPTSWFQKYPNPANAVGGLIHTMVHEIAHEKERNDNHGTNYNWELSEDYAIIGDDRYIDALQRLGAVARHPDVARFAAAANGQVALGNDAHALDRGIAISSTQFPDSGGGESREPGPDGGTAGEAAPRLHPGVAKVKAALDRAKANANVAATVARTKEGFRYGPPPLETQLNLFRTGGRERMLADTRARMQQDTYTVRTAGTGQTITNSAGHVVGTVRTSPDGSVVVTWGPSHTWAETHFATPDMFRRYVNNGLTPLSQ